MEENDSSSEETLDDCNWKESFDQLLNKRSLLRELQVIKSNVRISFNKDSSVEASRNNISGQDNLSDLKKYPKSISTPQVLNKPYGPFDCPLSPISSWQLTHFNRQDDWSPSRQKSCSYKKEKYLNQNPTLKSTKCTENRALEKTQHGCLPSSANLPVVKLCKSKALTEGVNFSVVLPPGKWRKSLTIWKKLNQQQPHPSDNNSKEKKHENGETSHKNTSFLEHPEGRYPYPSTTKSQKDLLKICKQKEVLPFSFVYSDYVLRNCRKIGEGTYGEVFLNSNEDGETVIKIIPIEGKNDVNGETQKGFEEILPEVLITQELSKLRECIAFMSTGFVFLKKVHCIMGRYPSSLIELWDLFKRNYGSENDHPKMFHDNQLYVALETAYGGTDLDKYVFRNSEQAYAVFIQVTASLAVAETHLQFEHRDLHSGNILIKPTNDKSIEHTIDCKKKNYSNKWC